MFLEKVSPIDIYDKLVEIVQEFKKAATRVVEIRQRNKENLWMTSKLLSAIKKGFALGPVEKGTCFYPAMVKI